MRGAAKLSGIVVAITILAPVAHGQALSQLLPEVVPNHPKVQVARANARAAGFDVEQAQAAWAVRFGLSADPGIASRNSTKAGAVATGDVSAKATKLLMDGGKADAETRRQQARAAASGHRVSLALEQLSLQITDAYLECVKQQALADEAQRNVLAHEDLVNRVADIVSVDQGRRSELDQARARLDQARVTLATRQASLLEARAALGALVKRPITTLTTPPSGAPAMPPSEQSALASLDRHPSVLAASSDVDAAREAAAIADAWRFPRIDVQASILGDTGPTGQHRYLNTADIRLVSNWTGFDGGASAAAALSSGQQMQSALETLETTKRDLATEVTRQWSAVQSRNNRTTAWQALVKQLMGVRDNYWEQFKIGRRAILDLLNVENEIFQARSSEQTDAADQEQARYRLLGATARLGEVFKVPGAGNP